MRTCLVLDERSVQHLVGQERGTGMESQSGSLSDQAPEPQPGVHRGFYIGRDSTDREAGCGVFRHRHREGLGQRDDGVPARGFVEGHHYADRLVPWLGQLAVSRLAVSCVVGFMRRGVSEMGGETVLTVP